jgi:signal transduction histidine kinase
MPPPAEPPKHENTRSGRQGESRQLSVALVHELSEALTAIGAYVEAAARLDAADSRSARTRLREALEKSQAQISRADALLRRLRDLLRDEESGADR